MSRTNVGPEPRIVAYARCSTTRQGESVADQLAWAARAAKVEGLTLARTFSDEGICGDDDARPGLAELLSVADSEFFANRQFTALAVWDLDRLSRASSLKTAATLSRLVDSGVTRVLTRAGWIDLSSSIDLLLMNVRSDFTSAGYVKSLSGNVTRTALKNAKEGKRTGGRVPRGYVTGKDGRLALGNPDDIDLVRQIFATYADDADSTTTGIARDLNARGIGTGFGGKMWRSSAVRAILNNRAYLGEARWFNKSLGKYSTVKDGEVVSTSTGAREQVRRRRELKRLPVVKGDAILVPGAHPAIIDEDTFARVQAKLASRRNHRGPAVSERWPLGGRFRCAGCGQPVWCVPTSSSAGRPRTRWLICGTHKVSGPGACPSGGRLRYEEVLRRVIDLLVDELCHPDSKNSLRASYEKEARAAAADLARQRERLERAVSMAGRDVAAAAKRLLLLPEDVLAEARIAFDGLRANQAKVQADLAAVLDRQRQEVGINTAYVEKMLASLPALKRLLVICDEAQAREILDGLASQVTIHFARTGHARATRGKPLCALAGLDVTLSPKFASTVGRGAIMGSREGSPGKG